MCKVKFLPKFCSFSCFLSACLPGMYGEGCMQRCSCAPGTSCHHISGDCGCPPGFTGNGCEQSECCLHCFSIHIENKEASLVFYLLILLIKNKQKKPTKKPQNTLTDPLAMHQKAETFLTNSSSLPQFVSQEHLDRTVTRSASALRRTNSATRCPDHVTVLQVSMEPNVT